MSTEGGGGGDKSLQPCFYIHTINVRVAVMFASGAFNFVWFKMHLQSLLLFRLLSICRSISLNIGKYI